jgi:hypothetical protein
MTFLELQPSVFIGFTKKDTWQRRLQLPHDFSPAGLRTFGAKRPMALAGGVGVKNSQAQGNPFWLSGVSVLYLRLSLYRPTYVNVFRPQVSLIFSEQMPKSPV